MLTIKKDGGGESSPTSNKVLTTDDAKLLIKQILGETFQFEIEPVEVKSFNPDGSIEGRYCVSEHDRKIQTFKPLNQNVIQYPVADEIVLGIEVFATIGPDNTPVGTRYYFSDLNPLPRRINSQQSNLSNTSSPDNLTNSIFIDEENIRTDVVEGDTIIQGRFDNSITLSSNQPTLNSPNTIIQNGEGQVLMTQNQKVDYSEPSNTLATKMGFDIDYDRPQIIFDSDRILLNAKTNDIGIFAEGDIFIKGNKVNIKNNQAVSIVTKQMVTDYSDGVKKDISDKVDDVDGDTKLLPANILPFARSMKPHIARINNGVISAASKILPPVVAPGVPNPLNISGHLLDLSFLKGQLKEVNDFYTFKWTDKKEWKTTSLNDVTEALGLNDLKTLETPEWDEFFDDIDKAKSKVVNIQTQVAAVAIAVVALNAAFDAIQQGGGSTQSIIEALDAYEADPNNPPLDTTDIRDVIASKGVDTEDVKRYLDFGGSPQVRELLISSKKTEQDAQKLSSMGIIAELIKLGENI